MDESLVDDAPTALNDRERYRSSQESQSVLATAISGYPIRLGLETRDSPASRDGIG